MYFEGQKQPITFGNFNGNFFVKAVFNDEQTITKVKVGEKVTYGSAACTATQFMFCDSQGTYLKGWHNEEDEKTHPSIGKVYNPVVDEDWQGKEVAIPEGYSICGFRVWTWRDGSIKWYDLKVWKSPF